MLFLDKLVEDINICLPDGFERITGKEVISIGELLGLLEELQFEKEHLEEELRNLEQDIEDNYRPVSISEQVGISDKDFI